MKSTVISFNVFFSEPDSLCWRVVSWASFGLCGPKAIDSDVDALTIIERQGKCFSLKSSFSVAHTRLPLTHRGIFRFRCEKFQETTTGVQMCSSFTVKAKNKRTVLLEGRRFDLHNESFMTKTAESLQGLKYTAYYHKSFISTQMGVIIADVSDGLIPRGNHSENPERLTPVAQIFPSSIFLSSGRQYLQTSVVSVSVQLLPRIQLLPLSNRLKRCFLAC